MTWFCSGRRPGAPSLVAAAASALDILFLVLRLNASREDQGRERQLQKHGSEVMLGPIYNKHLQYTQLLQNHTRCEVGGEFIVGLP